ncbi:hypothetical protein Tco_0837872 [Tanacetum coccineum]
MGRYTTKEDDVIGFQHLSMLEFRIMYGQGVISRCKALRYCGGFYILVKNQSTEKGYKGYKRIEVDGGLRGSKWEVFFKLWPDNTFTRNCENVKLKKTDSGLNIVMNKLDDKGTNSDDSLKPFHQCLMGLISESLQCSEIPRIEGKEKQALRDFLSFEVSFKFGISSKLKSSMVRRLEEKGINVLFMKKKLGIMGLGLYSGDECGCDGRQCLENRFPETYASETANKIQ